MTNATLSSKMAARCARSDRPVVAINRYLPHQDITSITCDNRGSAAAGGGSPRGARLQRLAFVAGIPDASSSRDSEQDFLRRLGQAGRAVAAHETGHYTHDGGAEAARRMLSATGAARRRFRANDLMAFGVMDAARDEFGLRIPRDLKSAGLTIRASPAGPPTTSPRSTRTSPPGRSLPITRILAALAGEATGAPPSRGRGPPRSSAPRPVRRHERAAGGAYVALPWVVLHLPGYPRTTFLPPSK